jgi:hypothetical protein
MMNRYDALELHLRRLPASTKNLTLSFDQIAGILGIRFPESAYEHREWWGNQKNFSTRPQARAWMSAGFLVDQVIQSRNNASVRFVRQPASPSEG